MQLSLPLPHARSAAHPGEPPRGAAGGAAPILRLSGWRRLGLAWLAGALGALAMPPFGWLPALAVSLSLAVWLMDGTVADRPTLRRLLPCLLVGWAWGFGYLTAGLWWLGSAFLVEAEEFAWALPLGVVGLPFALGLFYGAGFAAAGLLWLRGPGRIAAFAFGIAGAEWLRGHLFTGFPWNTLGMALGQNLWLMQAASVVGLYGLTLLAVLVCAAPATLLTGSNPRSRFGPSAAALIVLAALAFYGSSRAGPAPDPVVAGVRLRLVQPNLPQDAKFRPENRDDIVDRYVELTRRDPEPGEPRPTHIIWPESAFPFLIQRDPASLAKVGAGLKPGQLLLTGAARAEEPLPGERLRYYNAIMAIEPGGRIADTYDKVHLVPFGEYLPAPLDWALRAVGLRQFVAIPGGFTPGNRAAQRILTVAGLPPVAATICYEAIFPGAILPAGAADVASEPPGLILNLTNDAWFGDTPGPRQHLAQARLRAVEEGLPLVRDANTGISAVIDAHGRVTASLPLDKERILDADLPSRIVGGTPYAKLGDWPFALMLAACLGGALRARIRSTRQSSIRIRG
ncbi:apolipoprotein N-acyltransferase [Methylobacterium dankookense]|uniref:Apolipoprotein N-acyltransferase n=1 Tax=Methylobacterium dankookense TaxID=560405 RepID=A0A564FSS5_9HYPH|nr:apolipoprotein N-acyltransferase [Methylobacterium dankookense]GJD56634.1 Apolipoprotein N-acyltransferase [Methylobacterium dankookense]VUF10760.1 Apolipoprotein N-acyltransferase [Methylobacterium dankookense]